MKNEKSPMKRIRKNKGITLIALVITIIVLLILAGVSISMLTGENGILNRAKEAKEKTELATKEEEEILYELEDMINEVDTVVLEKGKVAEKTQKNNYIDQYGNKATIPEGFKVSINSTEDDINEGLVIKDDEGNEFVWIPVGDVKDKQGKNHKIELKRYAFTDEGEVDDENSTTDLESKINRNNVLRSKKR